ncbi:hypothetical protein GUJ93_ZPchr0009g1820 [Zizania palustris]|uniref:CCHC-type domain-containing protein n=1 Tax=Zizania palustris TaxID=103762 RepID=A0A8J5RLS5_ZIZPA|nr:hypothetical protein GUJ93_ZPchr0009g1820 [Zizania palustris]
MWAVRSHESTSIGGHDDDNGGSNVSSGASKRRRSSDKGRCFNCGVRGHFSRECTKLRKEEALLPNADEEAMIYECQTLAGVTLVKKSKMLV